MIGAWHLVDEEVPADGVIVYAAAADGAAATAYRDGGVWYFSDRRTDKERLQFFPEVCLWTHLPRPPIGSVTRGG